MNISLAIALSLAQAQDTPSLQSLEEAALQGRRRLERGHFVIDCRRTQGPAHPRPRTEHTIWKIWFDGDRRRVDYLVEENYGWVRQLICHHCERPKSYVWFDEKELGTAAEAVKVMPLTEPEDDAPRGAGRPGDELVFDPRVLGMTVDPLSWVYDRPLNFIVGGTDRIKPTVEKADWHGKQAWVGSYYKRYKSDRWRALVRIWFLPEMDNSVVKIEFDSRENDDVFTRLLDAELKQYGPNNIWFPSRISYEKRESGKVWEKEELTVTEVRLNEPVPDEVFTLAGMDLPIGIRVRVLGEPPYRWSGGALEKDPKAGPFRPDVIVEETPAGLRLGFVLGAIALALAAAGAFGYYFFRRRATSA